MVYEKSAITSFAVDWIWLLLRVANTSSDPISSFPPSSPYNYNYSYVVSS